MTALWRVMRLIAGAAPRSLGLGALLAALVLLAGAALLGLSGWFITATGLAGIAGIAFTISGPVAGVRALALGRTAGRYGERLLTHEATLRGLAALRVRLLRDMARQGGRALARLRSEEMLTRIVADVDALDGLLLRLVVPLVAALLTHLLVFLGLGWIVGWPMALCVLLGYLPAAALILIRLGRRGFALSHRAEQLGQELRRGVIDMLRDRTGLILAGQLGAREEQLVALDARQRAVADALDRLERGAGAWLAALVPLVAGAALILGAWLHGQGTLAAAPAAIGFFVALALGESLMPLRRGVIELGRMRRAAGRIALADAPPQQGQAVQPLPDAPLLEVATGGVRFMLQPGQAVALTGPSGVGKTSLLNAIAGLDPACGISLGGHAPQDWDEAALRDLVTLVPQRSALMAGSVRDNLALAGPEEDAALEAALEAVALGDLVRARGGLDARLGEGGAALSGGQARRLTLARGLLRRPKLLLLDEPTEGLDAPTAARVLAGVRAALPDAALLVVLHRGADHPIFDAVHRVMQEHPAPGKEAP